MKTNTQLFTRLFALIMFAFLYTQTLFSQALTVGEVHSYQVGDEFAVKTSFETGLDEFRIEKILKRTDFGSDSVQFIKEIILYEFNYQDLFWGKTKTVEKNTVFKLNEPYFTDFKQKDTFFISYDSSNNLLMWKKRLMDLDYTDSCQTLINERVDTLWTILSGAFYSHTKAYKGLGMLRYYHQYNPHEKLTNPSFIYYKKNGISCGDTGFQFMNIDKLAHENQLKIWPNPVNFKLYTSAHDPFTYKIYDSKGQLMLEGESDPQSGIMIHLLSNGIYYLALESGSTKHNSIFLKE